MTTSKKTKKKSKKTIGKVLSSVFYDILIDMGVDGKRIDNGRLEKKNSHPITYSSLII